VPPSRRQCKTRSDAGNQGICVGGSACNSLVARSGELLCTGGHGAAVFTSCTRRGRRIGAELSGHVALLAAQFHQPLQAFGQAALRFLAVTGPLGFIACCRSRFFTIFGAGWRPSNWQQSEGELFASVGETGRVRPLVAATGWLAAPGLRAGGWLPPDLPLQGLRQVTTHAWTETIKEFGLTQRPLRLLTQEAG